MASNKSDFWKKQAPHSKVKSEIVADYFHAYTQSMVNFGGITYIDLFSGRGEYEDNKPSTPILILDKLSTLENAFDSTKLFFIESHRGYFSHLKSCVENHRVYSRLLHKPQVSKGKVNQDVVQNLPMAENTFAFIDPCGVLGLSLPLIVSVIGRLRGDCIFLLSTSSVRRNLETASMKEEMLALFGKNALDKIKSQQLYQNGKKFEETVYQALVDVIKTIIRPLLSLKFTIEFADKDLESHSLIFVTKDPLGFKFMKEIMFKKSEKDSDDFPLYRYSCDKKRQDSQLLLKVDSALPRLCGRILKRYANRTMNVEELFVELDKFGEIYTWKNYEKALVTMEKSGNLQVLETGKRKRTVGRIFKPYKVKFSS